MQEDSFVPLVIFAAITAWVVFPLYFRNRLYTKQLDTVALAIEKGIDPDKIRLKLPREEVDPNGNWKAGIILIAIGVGFALMMALGYSKFDFDADDPGLMVFTPSMILVILGFVLLYIHRTIVGPVQRRKLPVFEPSDELGI